MSKFDIDKLVPQWCDGTRSRLILDLQMPILEALDRIISDSQDEVTIEPSQDQALQGHKIRVYLGKRDAHPAPIYVLVDEILAGQYTYNDRAFALRTLKDFCTKGDCQELGL